MTGQV